MDGTTLEAARPLLPAWVVWAPGILTLAIAALSLAATQLAAWLGARRVLGLPPETHWTERARLAFGVRRTVPLIGFALAFFAAALPLGGPLSRPAPVLRAAANLGLQALILVAGSIAVDVRLFPGPRLGERIRSAASWLVVLFPHYLVGIAFAAIGVRSQPIPAAASIAAVVTVLCFASGGGLAVGRALGLVRPAPALLARVLERALEGSARPPPPAFELRILSANAFALPQRGVVAITSGALAQLTEEELAAVMRHELAHLDEGRGTGLLRFAYAAALPLALVAGPALFSLAPAVVPFAMAALLLLWALTASRVSRPLEQRADAAAHDEGGAVYARALETLHRVNLVPAVLGRRASHPDLYDRMVAAGATPEWPRPAPPHRSKVAGAVLFLVVLAGTTGASTAPLWLGPDAVDDERGLQIQIALRHGADEVAQLGLLEFERGRYAEAATLYAAAGTIDPGEPLYPAVTAHALTRMGRCAEARATLDLARAQEGERAYIEAVEAELSECRPPDASERKGNPTP